MRLLKEKHLYSNSILFSNMQSKPVHFSPRITREICISNPHRRHRSHSQHREKTSKGLQKTHRRQTAGCAALRIQKQWFVLRQHPQPFPSPTALTPSPVPSPVPFPSPSSALPPLLPPRGKSFNILLKSPFLPARSRNSSVRQNGSY